MPRSIYQALVLTAAFWALAIPYGIYRGMTFSELNSFVLDATIIAQMVAAAIFGISWLGRRYFEGKPRAVPSEPARSGKSDLVMIWVVLAFIAFALLFTNFIVRAVNTGATEPVPSSPRPAALASDALRGLR
jgi:hypothetical protein